MDIFIARQGQREGPFTEEQVRAMLADGRLQPSDLAWRAGRSDWTPLSNLLVNAPLAATRGARGALSPHC
jgi:hypothetical protein